MALRNFPTRVTLGSSLSFQYLTHSSSAYGFFLKNSGSILSAFTCIVLNLKHLNALPFFPILSCVKMTGPLESTFISMANKSRRTTSNGRRSILSRMSKTFLINILTDRERLFFISKAKASSWKKCRRLVPITAMPNTSGTKRMFSTLCWRLLISP